MNKLKLFLYADGIVILAGAIFFAYLYLRRGRVDHFRDDLWQDRKHLSPEQRAAEDQRDQQFLVDDPDGYDFDPYGRTSPSIPRPGAPILTGAPKAAHAPKAPSSKPAAPKAAPRPAPAPPEFKIPNFRGKPHEILGIPENASADLVTRSHKFWIKRYHPDRVSHLGQTYIDQARRRAEQLNSARHYLLQALAQRNN
jgi:DnaJ-domain-containing protein 1